MTDAVGDGPSNRNYSLLSFSVSRRSALEGHHAEAASQVNDPLSVVRRHSTLASRNMKRLISCSASRAASAIGAWSLSTCGRGQSAALRLQHTFGSGTPAAPVRHSLAVPCVEHRVWPSRPVKEWNMGDDGQKK